MNNTFKNLPASLKDYKMLSVISRDILDIMKTDCRHTKVTTALKCKKCDFEGKIKARGKYLREKGFKDYHQFLQWKQVMDIMGEVKNYQNAKKPS